MHNLMIAKGAHAPSATNPNGSGHEWQLNMLAVRALIPTTSSTVESWDQSGYLNTGCYGCPNLKEPCKGCELLEHCSIRY
jgi:hypothetical protein